MKFLVKYDELIPGKNYPSMKEFFSNEPYYGQGEIIYYLRHGKEDMCRIEMARDVFSGKFISNEMIGMNDGEYTWFDFLAYYVEKYNLRLPEEFEKKILKK